MQEVYQMSLQCIKNEVYQEVDTLLAITAVEEIAGDITVISQTRACSHYLIDK